MADPTNDPMVSDQDFQSFDYLPNELYEITINLSDSFQYIKTNDARPANVRSILKEILEASNIKYSLRMEISRPRYGDLYKQSIARLHYHGYILFPTFEHIFTFFNTHWHKLTHISNICISYNPESNRQKQWLAYILKDRPYTPKAYFKLENIALKDIISHYTTPSPG
jgi:hypothetical protein